MRYLFALGLLLLFSCSEKEKESDEWKEMEDFHKVMADVYHPLKDSNNLEPIKKQADELAASASAWKNADLPEQVDNDETKGMLIKLDDGCQDIAKSIKNGVSDEEISTKLTSLHDVFHMIMEKWYESRKDEGSEEHHDHS